MSEPVVTESGRAAGAGDPTEWSSHPLEPDRRAMEEMAAAAVDLVASFVEGLPEAPAMATEGAEPLVASLLQPPAEAPGDFGELLDRFRAAASHVIETAGPSYMAYVGGGGLYTSALAELVARATNRFTGLAAFAPALVALEEGVLRWMGRQFGLPEGSGGLVTTGGSMATLTALVAARTRRLGDDLSRGTLYVTTHTHRSVAKAAVIAGLRADQIRPVPVTADLRMDPEAAAGMIAADRAAGRRPFLLAGTAGTTDTGAIDPLAALADVAERHGLWFHVDGAYGGFFHLTERGRARMAGIERADSLVLDPHKGLFLPHGTGVLLVRDLGTLRQAFSAGGNYLQDVADQDRLPDYADLGPELTRDHRGLRLWLPLHLHGVAAFRAALDEKLDLAAFADRELRREPALELPWSPELSIVAFRLPGRPGSPGQSDSPGQRGGPGEAGDAEAERANQELLARINATRRVHVSSTRIAGRTTLRLCIIGHRTHHDRVAEAVDIIRHAVRAVA